MNILSINKFYWKKGGSETVFFGEKELLEKVGHKVIPFSMCSDKNLPSEYSEFFVDEVNYNSSHLTDKISSAFKIIYSFDARKKINKLVSKHTPDLAHFHIFQHQISPSVFGPLRKRGIPIVLTLHDLKPLCPNYQMYVNGHVCEQCKGKKFYNSFLNSCTKGSKFKSLINTLEMYLHYVLGYYQQVDRYIAVSKFYQNKMVEYGFKPEQVNYIPNFINIDEFTATGKDENYAVFFGRLSHEKGVDTLINAAKICSDIPIQVIGTGPIEQELKAQVEQENINNVHFLGFKTGDELKGLISNASFTVIPSVWYENCPMSVLESFALGTPVIGSNIGGIPELIIENTDGLIFEPGNVQDLSAKMQLLWEKPRLRKEMGLAGRKKIAEHFTPAIHLEALMKVYQELI